MAFGDERRPLERRTPLARGPWRRRDVGGGDDPWPPPPAPQRRSRPDSGAGPGQDVPWERRIVVYGRDWDLCVLCGRSCVVGCRQCQHRVPRGMGGRWGHDRFSALLLLCGWSATEPDGCHWFAEQDRPRAEGLGLVVPDGVDPAEWPVRYSQAHGGGLWLLDDEGDRRRVA